MLAKVTEAAFAVLVPFFAPNPSTLMVSPSPMSRRIAPERVVSEAGAELAAAFGAALRTVVVYGSAETVDFLPERSDVNLAAVVEPLTFAYLQKVAQWYARWHPQRVAAGREHGSP